MNPERADDPTTESILYGGYWYGSMRVIGAAVPLLLIDGFVMKKARFYDSRVTGECDTEIVLRNLYHTSPCLHTIYSFDGLRADSPMHRTVLAEHVRLQKDFDELGYGRIFMSFASNKVTFRDLCIDGTTQLFGFTTISRGYGNLAGNSELTEAVFEDCYVAGIGGENGIGLLDIVENRLVGMKCRGVYETPGGAILYKAHSVLESICLDKETAHYKSLVAQKLAELVYNAQWFTPLVEAILSFVKTTQKTVTGDVTLKLYKGNMINAGVTSPYSLYDPEIATFDEDEVYDQKDSAGFINLYGLPTKVYAKMKAKNGIK
jgi:hypothetical protein